MYGLRACTVSQYVCTTVHTYDLVAEAHESSNSDEGVCIVADACIACWPCEYIRLCSNVLVMTSAVRPGITRIVLVMGDGDRYVPYPLTGTQPDVWVFPVVAFGRTCLTLGYLGMVGTGTRMS